MKRTLLLGVLAIAIPAMAAANLSIEVNLDDRQLRVYEAEELLDTYPISIGKDEKPTPTGAFTIRKIVWNPGWVPPNEKWARGKTAKAPGHPDNPMTRVKMFFKEPDYYIHGTGELDSLGQAKSHGCVRMAPDDVTELARLVMEHGGEPRPLPWYRRIFRSRSSKTVLLDHPVPIRIQ
ncbi:MAG TPA: L,D-transpeptidase [Thermoanaerobaculia bacterium]|nr:L,D-transpeptidase [Thermoanaerobaculia bacterium]